MRNGQRALLRMATNKAPFPILLAPGAPAHLGASQALIFAGLSTSGDLSVPQALIPAELSTSGELSVPQALIPAELATSGD